MSEIEASGNVVKAADEDECVVDSEAHGPVKIIAPQLRVEELRDDGHSSAASTSDLDENLSDRDDHDKSPKQEKPFVPPSDELRDKIIKQVEFYFCDANILKDAFLLKHVKRNKQGYVSLKLITSFRKIKSMTKDYRVTAFSLRQSTDLEVNEDGTKVRRKTPLPDYDETTPSRTIVAMNLPKPNPTIEDVAELFSTCGEISLIRVLKPGKLIPPDVKKHLNKHPEVGNNTCAVVEFEHHESAKKAVDTMTDFSDWRKGLSVTLLANSKKDKKNDKCAQRQQKTSTGEVKGGGDAQPEVTISQSDDSTVNNVSAHVVLDEKTQHHKNGKQRKEQTKDGKNKGRMDNFHDHDRDTGSDGEGSWRDSRNFTRDSLSPQSTKYSPAGSPRSSPRSSPRGSPNFRRRTASHGKSPLATNAGLSPNSGQSPCASPESRRKHNASLEASPSPSGSPWVQRRLKAQMEGQVSPLVGSPIGSPRLGRRLADLEGVVRQPKGPDGAPGFYGGKGRGKLVENQ